MYIVIIIYHLFLFVTFTSTQMTRVAVPVKTKRLVVNELNKLITNMDSLSVKNVSGINQFRSDIANVTKLLNGLSASLESLAVAPQSTQQSNEQPQQTNESAKVTSARQRPSVTIQLQPTETQPPPSEVHPQSNIPRRNKVSLTAVVANETPKEAPKETTQTEAQPLLQSSRGHKRVRKPKQ